MKSHLMWWTCYEWWIKPDWTLLDITLSVIISFWYKHSFFYFLFYLPIGHQSICSAVSMWFPSPSIVLIFLSPPFFVSITDLLLISFFFFFAQFQPLLCSLLFKLHSINIVVLSSCGQWNPSTVSDWSPNTTELIFKPLSEELSPPCS